MELSDSFKRFEEIKKSLVIRKGKKVKKLRPKLGYKIVDGRYVKMKSAERRKRSIAAKKSAKKKRGHQSQISRNRKKSMKKRTWESVENYDMMGQGMMNQRMMGWDDGDDYEDEDEFDFEDDNEDCENCPYSEACQNDYELAEACKKKKAESLTESYDRNKYLVELSANLQKAYNAVSEVETICRFIDKNERNTMFYRKLEDVYDRLDMFSDYLDQYKTENGLSEKSNKPKGKIAESLKKAKSIIAKNRNR